MASCLWDLESEIHYHEDIIISDFMETEDREEDDVLAFVPIHVESEELSVLT